MLARLRRLYRRWLDRRERAMVRQSALEMLRGLGNPRAAEVALAIEATVARPEPDDLREMQAIESLRSELAASDATMEIVDFGAGEPDSPFDPERARAGVKKTFPVRRLALHSSIDAPWCHLVYHLLRSVKPNKCLELGTCLGLSAAYQCSAMRRNETGALVTLEGDQTFATRSRDHLSRLGLQNFEIVVGRFEDTLAGVLETKGPFDFMFNDGHHDGQAMLSYFETTLPYFADGSVMLFDDIAHYESMEEGWHRLVRHPRVSFSLDFERMGLVCIGSPDGRVPPKLRVPLT